MNVFDLVLIGSVLIVLLGVLGLSYALITRRGTLFRHIALAMGLYVGVYAAVLVVVSLTTPQHVVALHEPRCFDDWCLAVESTARVSAIGDTEAAGVFYVVTLTASNHARGVSQRERDAGVYVIDDIGLRHPPSAAGQQALEAIGEAGLPLDTMMAVGGSFSHTAVFDLPPTTMRPALTIRHGPFPSTIIIGDSQSFLHKPTITPLDGP